jgi:hypothetical protein
MTLGGVAGTIACGAELKTELHWQAVEPGAAAVEVTPLPAGPSLEEIAKADRKPPPTARQTKSAPTVVQGESFPLAYRTILRRYFGPVQK